MNVGFERHTFRVEYDGGAKWFWFVDATRMNEMSSVNRGTTVLAGLESYATGNSMLMDINGLQYRNSAGTYTRCSGRDATIMSSGLCGAWLTDSDWRAGQPATRC